MTRKSVREWWLETRLWVGSRLLVAYAVAGGVVGIEVFAFLAVWPLAIGILLAGVAVSVTTRRRLRSHWTITGWLLFATCA